MNKFLLTPSIYCANTLDLRDEIQKLNAVGINWIHFDVMDGHFVDNYALSPKQITDIKNRFPKLTIDAHVMATNLINKVYLFAEADYLTFHINSVENKEAVLKLIAEIKKFNIKVGIALDIENEIAEITDYLSMIDLVTFMSIKSGFVGQAFNETTWSKLDQIKNLKEKYPHLLFQIDGGVRWNNIEKLITSGLDLIVVGSLLFSEVNYQDVIGKLAKYQEQETAEEIAIIDVENSQWDWKIV